MANTFQFLISNRPVYLVFHVTGRCNLQCRHCFNEPERSSGNTDLTLEEIEKTARNMGHIKYLTLGGGEPFLREDLEEIVSLFKRHNDIHLINIVTNGWYTDRIETVAAAVLKKHPKLHMSIGVSLDGPEPVHDSLRGRQGSWQRAVATLDRLKRLENRGLDRLTVAACGTYNRYNANHLKNLADYLRESLSVPFFPGLIRGDTMPDTDLTRIDIAHYMKLLHEINYAQYSSLAKNYPFRHIRLAVDQIVSEIIYDSRKKNQMTLPCMAGKKGIVLTATGELLLCEVLGNSLGNIRDFGYEPYRILDLKESKSEIKSVQEAHCHCSWECFQRLNVVFGPKKYPDLLIRSLRNFING